jgi:uncharacterized YccA/Bax inhibitor family protein
VNPTLSRTFASPQSSAPDFQAPAAWSQNPGYSTGYAQPQTGQPNQIWGPPAQPWTQPQGWAQPQAPAQAMSLQGVLNKTTLVLVVSVLAAAVGWFFPVLWMIALVPALILGLVNSFKREPVPALVIAYGATEGLVLGGVSSYYEAIVPGVVFQAVAGTMLLFVIMLWLYRTERFRLSGNASKILVGCMLAYAGVAMLNLILVWSGVATTSMYQLEWNGIPVGILISVVAVALGAISLTSDFGMIDNGVRARMPERYEWSAAFGIILSLVWLYLEIIRLIANLRR